MPTNGNASARAKANPKAATRARRAQAKAKSRARSEKTARQLKSNNVTVTRHSCTHHWPHALPHMFACLHLPVCPLFSQTCPHACIAPGTGQGSDKILENPGTLSRTSSPQLHAARTTHARRSVLRKACLALLEFYKEDCSPGGNPSL